MLLTFYIVFFFQTRSVKMPTALLGEIFDVPDCLTVTASKKISVDYGDYLIVRVITYNGAGIRANLYIDFT